MKKLNLQTLILGLCLISASLAALIMPPTATSIELLEARIVPSDSSVIASANGGIRLENPQLSGLASTVIVPEPLGQEALGWGALLLLVLGSRSRGRSQRSQGASLTKHAGIVSIALSSLVLSLASPAWAQVPHSATFSGRLVDDQGAALSGPIVLELRVFDALTSGNQLYSELHLATPLGGSGEFSVPLGLGTSPSGAFNSELFSSASRFVEVVAESELLSPRVSIRSAPYALIAERANEIIRDPNAPRFEDCGDGTFADHQTGLQWENKTGSVGTAVDCDVAGCPDPHNVNNQYALSSTGSLPDGSAIIDFIAKLNDPTFGEVDQSDLYSDPSESGCFSGVCDWRIPTIAEVGSILVGPEAAPGQNSTCSQQPCLDPALASIAGPTMISIYGSSSTLENYPTLHISMFFSGGSSVHLPKTSNVYYLAARTGTCR